MIARLRAALARVSHLQRRLLLIFAAFSLTDVAVSCFLFYGLGTFTEVNPLFAWAVDSPALFVPLLLLGKIGALALVAGLAHAGNRVTDGAGTMVIGTADLMTAGMFGIMAAGIVGA